MKAQQLTCPDCGAHLTVAQPRSFIFCEYCGAQIYIDDEVKRTEHTININHKVTIDKKQVIEDRAEIEKQKSSRAGLICALLMFVVLQVPAIFILNPSLKDSIQLLFQGQTRQSLQESGITFIVMPSSSDAYSGEDYEDVVKELKDAGFTDVVTVKDQPDSLLVAFFYKQNEVMSVTINGRDVEAGKEYRSDSTIVVSYYYLSNSDTGKQ